MPTHYMKMGVRYARKLTTAKGFWKAYHRALLATTAIYMARKVTQQRKCTKAGYVRCPCAWWVQENKEEELDWRYILPRPTGNDDLQQINSLCTLSSRGRHEPIFITHLLQIEQWWVRSDLGACMKKLLVSIGKNAPYIPTQHFRHHFSGEEKSRSGIKASVRPISSPSPSAPSRRDGGGFAGPGSRARMTIRDENAIKVRVYVINRWVTRKAGWWRVCKWKSTRT